VAISPSYRVVVWRVANYDMPRRFNALSILLSVVLRPGCDPSGPNISLTLNPARDAVVGPLASRLVVGGVERPVSLAGGRTCGGWSPAGNPP